MPISRLYSWQHHVSVKGAGALRAVGSASYRKRAGAQFCQFGFSPGNSSFVALRVGFESQPSGSLCNGDGHGFLHFPPHVPPSIRRVRPPHASPQDSGHSVGVTASALQGFVG